MRKKMMAIDAGSTNYTKALVMEDGTINLIENELGEMMTPASILFTKKDDQEYVVTGRQAKEQSILMPVNYYSSWKRLMGGKEPLRVENGKEYTPTTLTSIMLKQMKKDVEDYIGCEINAALITTPDEYTGIQKEALKEAARISGFTEIHLMSESGAATTTANANNDFRGTVGCLDSGGNTTDFTACNVSATEIQTLFTKGDLYFAGKEFDECMEELVKSKLGTDSEKSFSSFAEQELTLKSEKAKEDLSKLQKVSFPFCMPDGETVSVQITRKEYEEACMKKLIPEFKNYLNEIKNELNKRGLTLSHLVLTGGNFNIPLLQTIVKEEFQDTEVHLNNPEFSICMGAAQQAVNIMMNGGKQTSGDQTSTEQGIGTTKKFIPVCNRSYGIEAYTYEDGKEILKITNMLFRNSALPAVLENREYYTRVDNQKKVAINIYESDMDASYLELCQGTKIAAATLEIQGNLPKNSPVKVTMSLDTDYNLHVEAREESGNTKITANVKVTPVMSEEEQKQTKELVEDIFDRAS